MPKMRDENKKSKRMGKVAGQEALKYSEDFDMYSKLQRRTRKRRVITHIRWSDLKIGKLLGEGNFSHVYEIQLRKHSEPLPDDVETVVTEDLKNGINSFNVNRDKWNDEVSILTEEDQQLDVWDLVSTTGDNEEGDDEGSSDEENDITTYALKHLHPQMTEKQRDFTAGAIDLVLEAKILACLDHPNIVKLYGVTKGSISNVFSGNGYFLLLDRLHGTLEDRIQDWISIEMTSNAKRRNDMAQAHLDPNEVALQAYKEKVKLVEDRLQTVALDVARGMEYLHQHRIVFRDLKPSNVGFTAKGTVRIFDFGLAKEIIDSRQRLTGNTGSLRYMAPEGKNRLFLRLTDQPTKCSRLLYHPNPIHTHARKHTQTSKRQGRHQCVDYPEMRRTSGTMSHNEENDQRKRPLVYPSAALLSVVVCDASVCYRAERLVAGSLVRSSRFSASRERFGLLASVSSTRKKDVPGDHSQTRGGIRCAPGNHVRVCPFIRGFPTTH